MPLEKQLTSLDELQIANVSEVIGTITKQEQEIATNSFNKGSEISGGIEYYKNTIKTKLLTIMGNIISLGEKICNAEDNQFYSFEPELFDYSCPSIKIVKEGTWTKPKGIFRTRYWIKNKFSTLEISARNIPREIGFQTRFKFNSSDFSLFDIVLGIRDNYSTFEDNYSNVFSSKNAEEFTSKYLEHIEKDLKKDGTSPMIYLPHVLNLVPIGLAKLYTKKNEEERKRLERINGNIQLRMDESDKLNVQEF